MRWVVWFFCFGIVLGVGVFGCQQGECRYDTDCPKETSICREGICTDNLTKALCQKKADCQPNQECIKNKCITPECQENQQRPCYSGPVGTQGKGLCRGGIQNCNNGRWGTCFGQILPTSEVCDQLDNDCNDKVDDSPSCNTSCKAGETRSCFTGPPAVRGKGICRAGSENCKDGKWSGVCLGQTLPQSKEICGDNLDNNCNGAIDENCGACKDGQTRPCYTGPASTRGVGICQDGQRSCKGGVWGACIGQVIPSTEVCNKKDDDCNNKVDELPSCKQSCNHGETRDCYTGQPASSKNKGLCQTGKETCENGVWKKCQGEVVPVAEKCGDGKDNNCNGQIDEGCNVCKDGAQEPCYEGQQGCSKNTDGSFSCNTPCRAGVRTCRGGQWTSCIGQTIPKTKEVCGNNVDDDCNGQVDDGCGVCTNGQVQPCYTGPSGTQNVGLCRAGTKTCTGQNWGACIGEIKPTNEVCGDGKDNNCDKRTDENCATKLHQKCQAAKDCDIGQVCLLAGTQGYCFQDCSTSATVCQNNADGRTSCEVVARSAQGANIAICIKKVSKGSSCAPLQSIFCTTGHSCIAGVCKQVIFVNEGGVCDGRATPPKLCQGNTTCVQLAQSRPALCYVNCLTSQASCAAGFQCLGLKGGNGRGVCVQVCTASSQCRYSNNECVAFSGGANICAPRP